MKKSIVCVLSVAAVLGAALTSTAASAAVTANPPAGGDPDTTVTFAVTTGALTMTAPLSANLGSGLPGSTITSTLTPVTVTDERALLGGAWTVLASSSDFITGAGTGPETIPATDATYNSGTPVVTGNFVATPTPITLNNGPQAVVTATGSGNNAATWTPTIVVAVPTTAVGGTYTATLTEDVTGTGPTARCTVPFRSTARPPVSVTWATMAAGPSG